MIVDNQVMDKIRLFYRVKEEYLDIVFETIKKETPKTYNLGLEYLDYCTNDYVENATIKVHSGNSCSGS